MFQRVYLKHPHTEFELAIFYQSLASTHQFLQNYVRHYDNAFSDDDWEKI